MPDAKALSEKLRSSISRLIIENSYNYELLERSQMDKIFAQFEIQNTGCTDISCAVEFGKMLNVERIIIGSVSKVGSTYMVICRIVEIETSKTLQSVERRNREAIDNVIDLMPLVAEELIAGERLSSSQSENNFTQITPIQISILNPIQLFPEETNVKGIRLGIFGVNRNVGIIDIGIINRVRENMTGVQFGFINKVDGRTNGLQAGYILNYTDNFNGFQGGIGNCTMNKFTGFQLGFMNIAVNMNGVQLGYIFNYSRDLNGFQFALINIHRNGHFLAKVLPIINYSR